MSHFLTTEDVERLKNAVSEGEVYWMDPNTSEVSLIRSISNYEATPGDYSPCAYFPAGDCVALYNTETKDFIRFTPVFEDGA